MRIKNFILFFMALYTNNLVYARSCDNSEYDKAEYFSGIAGRKIISKFGGGQDEIVSISNCSFNSYSKIFNLDLDISWNGSIFSSNHYAISGKLKMSEDGSDSSFAETWENEELKDYRLFRGFVLGAIVLGTLADSSSNSSSD